MALLSEAGISTMGGNRKLMVRASGFPMEVLYLRDDDIPQAVSMGVTDIGIVGLNEVEERGFDVEVVMKLGFGACRISLAVPRDVDYNGPEWFNGKRVATSYPHILKKYFDEHGIRATIHEIAGSVEVAPAVGMADAIFDIVSSGGTLLQNGLVEVEQVIQSEAVLIASRNITAEKRAASRGMKYLLMNLPEASIERAVAILPGMKSPTLLPLVAPGWFSLQAVIKESELWDKIQQLKEVGAEDILVLQLENIIR
jgi:ATP phosphoribosyltransferase